MHILWGHTDIYRSLPAHYRNTNHTSGILVADSFVIQRDNHWYRIDIDYFRYSPSFLRTPIVQLKGEFLETEKIEHPPSYITISLLLLLSICVYTSAYLAYQEHLGAVITDELVMEYAIFPSLIVSAIVAFVIAVYSFFLAMFDIHSGHKISTFTELIFGIAISSTFGFLLFMVVSILVSSFSYILFNEIFKRFY